MRHYGAPIAFAFLLMGVIYFFPGFCKTWRSGLDWAFSESPTFTLYKKWHMSSGEILSSVDRHRLIQQMGAFSVMVFELSFVFLLFHRRTRLAAAILRLGFHTAGNITGNYGFRTLMACYVIFVDWAAILAWIGRLIPPDRFTVGIRTDTLLQRVFLAWCARLTFSRSSKRTSKLIHQKERIWSVLLGHVGHLDWRRSRRALLCRACAGR